MSQKPRSGSAVSRKLGVHAQSGSIVKSSQGVATAKQQKTNVKNKTTSVSTGHHSTVELPSFPPPVSDKDASSVKSVNVERMTPVIDESISIEDATIEAFTIDKGAMKNYRQSATGRCCQQSISQLCCSVPPVAVVSPVTLSNNFTVIEESSQPASIPLHVISPQQNLAQNYSISVVQCHVMAPRYVVVTSLESPTKLQLFQFDALSPDFKACRLVTELACDSPVQCFLCLELSHSLSSPEMALADSCELMTSLLLAATDAGRLLSWKLKYPKASNSDMACDVYASNSNQFALHLPNPIKAISASKDGRHLATGCCFEMYDIAAGGTLRRSVRGTVKTWDLSAIVDCAINIDNKLQNEVVHKCMKTFRQLSRCSYAGNTRDPEEPLGIGALSHSGDSRLLAVGFTRPTCFDMPAAATSSPTLVICCAETLDTLWAIEEAAGWCVDNLAFVCSSESVQQQDHSCQASLSNHQLLMSTSRSLRKFTVILREQEPPTNDNNYCPNDHTGRLISPVVVACEWGHEFDNSIRHLGLATCDNSSTVLTVLGSDLVSWNINSGQRVDAPTCTIVDSNPDEDILSIVGVGLSRDGQAIATVSLSSCSILVCAAFNFSTCHNK